MASPAYTCKNYPSTECGARGCGDCGSMTQVDEAPGTTFPVAPEIKSGPVESDR